MYSYWLKKVGFDNALEKTLETTLIVRYNDFDNQYKIICNPGGVFVLNTGCVLGVEPGQDIIITYRNDVIYDISRGNKYTFCGYIEYITYAEDPLLPPNYYHELHPKRNVRGQKELLPNIRLLIPIRSNKVIVPTKPIRLEYRKGPCKNYYEVV